MSRGARRVGVSRRALLLGGVAAAGGALLGARPAWAAPEPPIIDCASWGARPPGLVLPILPEPPIKIIVHHTATPNVEDTSRDAAIRLARGIQNFHMDVRGWGDSGQHFTISRGGYVTEGRWHSLETLRSGRGHVEGAHCRGQNRVAIGIESEGTYTAADPPPALWDRLREMCAYACRQYGIPPTEIDGHRDFRDTACPGDVLYGLLPTLRAEVADLLGQELDTRQSVRLSWPLLRIADRGPAVKAAQHLLRDAGFTDVVPDGLFDRRTADAVRAFQSTRGAEETNGMIGGESWPLLARPVDMSENGEAALAVRALLDVRAAEGGPLGVVDHQQWQWLLAVASSS